MHPKVGIFLRALADFFLPRRCVVCGRMLSLQEKYICLHCDADLPLTYDWNREQNAMSDRYNQRIQDWLCTGYSSPDSVASGGGGGVGAGGAVAGAGGDGTVADASAAASVGSAASAAGVGSAVASADSAVASSAAGGPLNAAGGAGGAVAGAAGVAVGGVGAVADVGAVAEPYQRACALFYYDAAAGYKEIPQALKYGGALSMGRHFARRLGARLAESPLYEDVDLIVPVPLHGFRHFRRGYNQAEIIARALAEKMGKSDKLCVNLLRRTRHTKTQTQLSIEQKQRNVADAFRVSPRSFALLSRRTPANSQPTPGAPSGFPRHILLVDDVFTTGSTLSQCHKALRQVFPPTVRISVATLAFVGGA